MKFFSSAARRRVAVAVTGLLVTVSMTACFAGSSIGEPRAVDGGTQIVVPALWASDATKQGGIEPATIWVTTQRTSNQLAYEVNLSDVEAKGGGAMWRAATSSAAAIGTLFSGFDPDDIGYRFDITGPIDGPSAGAILTVGVLAALNNHKLNKTTTMTGTISPDGSIGPVGLIPLKIKAAADAGFKKVLIPASLTKVRDPETGDSLDTQSYGQKLGVEVIFVQSVAEAYLAFTGTRLLNSGPSTAFAFENFSELDARRKQAARALQQTVQGSIDAHPQTPASARQTLADAVEASTANDPSAGFALAVDALDQFADWRGSTSYRDQVTQLGSTFARERFVVTLGESSKRIETILDAAVNDAQRLTTAELLAFPGALGWLTYAQAVLLSMQEQLKNPAVSLTDAALAEYAGLAGQVVSEAENVFPQAMTVLTATPDSGTSSKTPVNDFLSGYTTFLVAAGDANLGYLRAVKRLSVSDQSRYSVLDLVPVVAQLGEEAKKITSTVENLGSELKESSLAMSYFVASTSLVSSAEVFGNSTMWLSTNQALDAPSAYVENTIQESGELVHTMTNRLLAQNFNAGFTLWSADWGTAAYAELSSREQTARGASLALNELWYDVISVLSMNAYLNST